MDHRGHRHRLGFVFTALLVTAGVAVFVGLRATVHDLDHSLDHFYGPNTPGRAELPRGLDGALRTIFEDAGASAAERRPASALIRRLENDLMDSVYRWTGHFPERTRALVRFLAERADQLQQVYAADHEASATVGVTTLVTALAVNYVHRGTYLP